MYLFLFRSFTMGCYFFVAGLLWHGCTYNSYVALAEAASLFGIMSSGIYCLATLPRYRSFFQKIGLFHFLMNTFIILFLWRIIPGFYLESSSTALWLSGLVTVINFAIQFFSTFNQLHAQQEKSKMKSAKAKVISSREL